jgi:hypothetical protein
VNCIEKLSQLSDEELKKKGQGYTSEITSLLPNYSEEAWYQGFLKLNEKAKPQKIVLVSDFISKVGGIETYLHDVKAILEAQGHEVFLWGGTLSK